MNSSPEKTPRFSLSSSGGGTKRNYHPHMTPDLMEASFSLYDGWERRSIELKQGQRIRLVLEQRLEAGSVHCEVSAPDGVLVLRLGNASVDEGELTAAFQGKYPVRVMAENASGSYRLALHGG